MLTYLTIDGGMILGKYSYFAQPIENIKTNHIILYELLLREWNDDTQTWRTPASFEITAPIMVHLLQTALAKLDDPHVSINLTTKQFADPAFTLAITDFVREHMLPRQLTVELVDCPTFTVLKEVSASYRAAGVLLALDDVGSDNLYGTVKDMLPYVNTIKFAMQNLRDGGPTTQKQIEELHFWFHKSEEQQMLFTFEGIEDQQDIDLASHFGISRGQGYYFSRPREPQLFHDGHAN